MDEDEDGYVGSAEEDTKEEVADGYTEDEEDIQEGADGYPEEDEEGRRRNGGGHR